MRRPHELSDAERKIVAFVREAKRAGANGLGLTSDEAQFAYGTWWRLANEGILAQTEHDGWQVAKTHAEEDYDDP